MILQNLIKTISERMSIVGVVLCVALVALVGCPDAPDTAPPVITLTGTTVIVVDIGETFTDPGFTVNDNDPDYTGTVIPTVTGSGNTIDTTAAGVYTITYTALADAAGNSPASVTRTVRVGADADGNSHTDINFLEDLDAVRTDLTSTYELTRDLDFADGDSYADGTVNAAWRPNATNPDSATNEGWAPIGGLFSGSFCGNDFVIANLYIRRSGVVGLFGTNSGTIQRIGVVDVNIYGGAGDGDAVGGLVGSNSGPGAAITASYATGNVNGGDGQDTIGGLVGSNTGAVTASYATGDVDGGAEIDAVGGLVGTNEFGTITASYATGDVDGGAGADNAGGLAGQNITNATVTASYATGDVDGGADIDNVGGLLGRNTSSDIASYGFGTATGESTAFGALRSPDASPPATVPDACAITPANSSMTERSRWDADQWDFGTAAQRPVVLDEDGNIVRGQEDRGC